MTETPTWSGGAPAAREPGAGVARLFQRAEHILAAHHRCDQPKWLARAPGRLEAMGGLVEYSGGTVVGVPLEAGVAVTVTPVDERRLVVIEADQTGESGGTATPIDLAVFDNAAPPAQDSPASARRPAMRPGGPGNASAAVAAAVYAMRYTGKLAAAHDGAIVVVDADLPPVPAVGYGTAVMVAACKALAAAWGVRLDPFECAHLALHGQAHFLGMPCGMGTAACMLHARAGCLAAVQCHSMSANSAQAIPPDVAIVGVDTAQRLPDAAQRYRLARTAAFMGGRLIQEAVAQGYVPGFEWQGCLADVTIENYTDDNLRDRIPCNMKGKVFLDRFGDSPDPLSPVEPEILYKIRSRTEHHIYENRRAVDFCDLLARAAATGHRKHLIKAGEVMLGSHWSYGQRCGLGSVQTDLLVNLIRHRGGPNGGPQRGLFGAKTSDQGSGGVVVVLLSDTEEAHSHLRDALAEYNRRTGLIPTLLAGTSDGAEAFGVHEA